MFSLTIIKGRLVDTPELKTKVKDGNETIWVSYRVAVNRDRRVEGQADVDFFNCITFGKRAEYIAKCGQKGTMVLVSGRLQIESYINKEQVKVPVVQLLVDKQEICSGWKQQEIEEVPEREFTHVQDYLLPSGEYMEDEYELPL